MIQQSLRRLTENFVPGDRVLGDWEITDVLGTGGYSTVYEIARERQGYREISVFKVIQISLARLNPLFPPIPSESDRADRIRRTLETMTDEISRMALDPCDRLVRVLDLLVLEDPDGKSWQIQIRREKLQPLEHWMRTSGEAPERLAARLGIQIAEALEACHRNGIVHRDVKPSNLLVDNDGNFRLEDIGIARLAEAGMQEAVSDTRLFRAPEQAHGSEVHETADIYALGLLLYQILNNQLPPFCTQTSSMEEIREALNRRLAGEPLPLPANADRGLGEIVRKACAPKPEDRYKDAAALKQELQAWEKQSTPRAFGFANTIQPAREDDRRLALVMGNAAYMEGNPLRNTVNDAVDMAEALRRLRFDVILGTNLTFADMKAKEAEFLQRLPAYDTSLLFFSGHGSQIAGANQMLSIDSTIPMAALQEAKTQEEFELALSAAQAYYLEHTFSLDEYLRNLAREGKGKLHLCILDCCRTDPFKIDNMYIRRFDGTVLRQITPVNTYISFATAPDEPSLDGTPWEGHGTYTGQLLKHIEEKDILIEEMFKKVRVEVARKTGGSQITWEHSSLLQDFCFNSTKKNRRRKAVDWDTGESESGIPKEPVLPVLRGKCPACRADVTFAPGETVVTCRFCRKKVDRTETGGIRG